LLIAQISDLHINTFFNDSILKRVNFLLKEISESKADHLIITGDITDNASEKDLAIFRKLLKKYGFLAGERLSIIIGNHDIFGGVQKAEDIFSFPERCKSINYNSKLNYFLSFFPEAFNNCFYLSTKNYFPFAKKLDNVLLTGLNSIAPYSKLSNPFGSNGEVDAGQFGELVDIFNIRDADIKFRIVLIHHHFNKLKNESKSTFGNLWANIEKQTMKLRGKRRLLNLFRQYKVDIVLHGHIHESKEYDRKGIRFLNAGATIKNNKDFVQLNYLRIGKNKIDIEIERIAYPEVLRSERGISFKNEQHKLINAAMVI